MCMTFTPNALTRMFYLTICHAADQPFKRGIETQDTSTTNTIESLENPWSAADTLNKTNSVNELPGSSPEVTFDLCDCQPPEGVTVKQEMLVRFVNIIYTTLIFLLPGNGQSKDTWASAFRKFHQYLLSDEYKQHLCLLFQTPFVSPVCNRYATKLVFSIHHAVVAARANTIRQDQENKGQCTDSPGVPQLTSVAKAKVRYVAGACLSAITTRLRKRAVSNITNTDNSGFRKQAYTAQRLLSRLRISECNVISDTFDPDSLAEINSKQSITRGLFHIPDCVFQFFLQVHVAASRYLSDYYFKLYREKAFTKCREVLLNDSDLLSLWSALFTADGISNDTELELIQSLVHELYCQVTEHYLRICFVDALHAVKEHLPKTKKQALRAKIEGATKIKVNVKPEQKRKQDVPLILCPLCKKVCVEEPQCISESS